MILKNKWLRRTIPIVSLGLLLGFSTVNLSCKPQTQIEEKKDMGIYQTQLKESYDKLEAIVENSEKPTVIDAIRTSKTSMYLSQPEANAEYKETLDEGVLKLFEEKNIDEEKVFKTHILLSYSNDVYLRVYEETQFKEQFSTYEEFIKALTIQQINDLYRAGSIVGEKLVINDDKLEGLNILLNIRNVPKVRDYLEKIVIPSGVHKIVSVKTQDAYTPKEVLKMTDAELEEAFYVEDYSQEISSKINKETVFPALQKLNERAKAYTGKEYTDEELGSLAENYALFYKTFVEEFSHEEQPIAIDVYLPPDEDGRMSRLAFSVIKDKNGKHQIWLGSSATDYKEWKDFALKVAENVDQVYVW